MKLWVNGFKKKVTPYLNEVVGEDHWEVDIQNPQKTLTVVGEAKEVKVKEAVQRAGFKVEKVA